MPLLTQQGNGHIFIQATQPAGWANGDLWIDSSYNLWINNAGAAVQIAVGTLGTANQIIQVNSGATGLQYTNQITIADVLALG